MQYIKTLLFLGSLLGVGLFAWRQLLTAEARRWSDYRFAVVVPLVAVGLYAPSIWLYYGAILAAMLVLPRTRLEAAGLYLFLAFLLPLVNYDLRIASVWIMRLSGNVVAAIGLLAAFRFPAARAVSGRGGGGVTLAAALLVTLLAIIIMRIPGLNATVALRTLLTITLTYGIPYLLIAHTLGREQDFRRPLFYLMAAGFMLSIVATYETLRHWPLYSPIDANLGSGYGRTKWLAIRGGMLRAPGPFFESTTFGVFLAVCTISTAAMRSVFRSRPAHLAAIAVGCIGCFATLSRNSWIGVLLGILMIGLYRGRVGRAAGVGALIAVVAGGLFLAAPESGTTAALLGKGNTHAASTAEYRELLLDKSWPLIRKSPWIGNDIERVDDLLQPDLQSGINAVDWVNSYLYFTVALGFLGLAAFCIFMFYPAWALVRVRRNARARPYDLEVASALFAVHLSLAFMVFGTSFFERIPVLAVVLAAMTRMTVVLARRPGAAAATAAPTASAPEFRIADPARPMLEVGAGRIALPAAQRG